MDEMIKNCPFCGNSLEKCNCKERRQRSNMIDSSIFLGAHDEGEYSEECKLIVEGAKKKIYFGNVSSLILGEITKKLLKIRKEASYRYDEIYNDIMANLLNFKIHYICDLTIDKKKSLGIRLASQSHDALNFACAIENKCTMFIMKDEGFSYGRKERTKIIQISDMKNKKLRNLLDEIKSS